MRAVARDVVDIQARLAEAMGDPNSPLREYASATAIGEYLVAGVDRARGYVQDASAALERVQEAIAVEDLDSATRQLAHVKKLQSQARNGIHPTAQALEHTGRVLAAGESYHVSDDMHVVIQTAAERLRDAGDDVSISFEPETMPTTSGFVLMAHADTDRYLREAESEATLYDHGITLPIQTAAMSWGPCPVTRPQLFDPERPERYRAGYRFTVYTDADKHLGWMLLMHRLFREREGKTPEQDAINGYRSYYTRLRGFPLVPVVSFTWPVAPVPLSAFEGVDNKHVHDFVLMFWTFFHLCGQTVTAHETERSARPVARRWRHMPMPKQTTVIQLRRRSSQTERVGEGNVQWSHRWLVRGHWHTYWCGPGRTEKRVVWLNPYFKGPDEAPLVITDKVYDLVR